MSVTYQFIGPFEVLLGGNVPQQKGIDKGNGYSAHNP